MSYTAFHEVFSILEMLLEIGLLKKKKKENKTKAKKEKKRKEMKIALSLGYPNSYFYNKKEEALLKIRLFNSFFF